jgi:hypothetical protein
VTHTVQYAIPHAALTQLQFTLPPPLTVKTTTMYTPQAENMQISVTIATLAKQRTCKL